MQPICRPCGWSSGFSVPSGHSSLSAWLHATFWVLQLHEVPPEVPCFSTFKHGLAASGFWFGDWFCFLCSSIGCCAFALVCWCSAYVDWKCSNCGSGFLTIVLNQCCKLISLHPTRGTSHKCLHHQPKTCIVFCSLFQFQFQLFQFPKESSIYGLYWTGEYRTYSCTHQWR